MGLPSINSMLPLSDPSWPMHPAPSHGWRTAFEETTVEARTLDQYLQDIQNFNQSFAVLRAGGNGLPPVPVQVQEEWDKIWASKDRMMKVKDYVKRADEMEESLAGPRPESVKDVGSKVALQTSVSARMNKVVDKAGEIGAACDKATRLIGRPGEQGIGADVAKLEDMIDASLTKLRRITLGKEEAPAKAIMPLLPVNPPEPLADKRESRRCCSTHARGAAFL
mmetsp:Transcript_23274/g.42066  ORF Transcript_23274/g.42066 Transcript_23274/m.42066 type:complete len:223 (-) Transcript_23274:73-741(-)